MQIFFFFDFPPFPTCWFAWNVTYSPVYLCLFGQKKFVLWSLAFPGQRGEILLEKDRKVLLQQQAPVPLLPLADLQRRPGGHFEYFPHALLSLGWAFQVSKGANTVGHVSALLRFNRLLRNRWVGTESSHSIRFRTKILCELCAALSAAKAWLMTCNVNSAR